MSANSSNFPYLLYIYSKNIRVFILTLIIVPLALSIAAISSTSTIIVFVIIGFVLFYMRYYVFHIKRRIMHREISHFFLLWLLSSLISLISIFQIFVVSLLEILPEENLLLLSLTVISLIFLYNAKRKSQRHTLLIKDANMCDIEATPKNNDTHTLSYSNFCFVCRVQMSNENSHCVWLDCCIGNENNRFFSYGVFFGMLASFYGANLTLTTVCHPFLFYKLVLLPDDCSDVYYQYNIAICFICGIYSFIIACILLLSLLYNVYIRIQRSLFHNIYYLHAYRY